MNSLISKSLLGLIATVGFTLGISSRVFAQSSCLTFSSTHTIIYYEAEGPWVDTVITLTNTSNEPVEITEPIGSFNGDTDILHFQSHFGEGGLTLPPGTSFNIDFQVGLECPPTKDVYTVTFESLSQDGTPCSTDTITVRILFLFSDTITLDVPPASNTISVAPSVAHARHVVQIRNSGAENIRLDSLQITEPSNIAFFTQESDKTFVSNDSLPAGQSNTSAIMTLYPQDTGIHDVGLKLHYNGGVQPYTIQDSVSHNSLNAYPLVVNRPISFNNLIPDEKQDTTFYIVNTFPDTITITQLIPIGDFEQGVPWSIDTAIGVFPVRLPIELLPGQHVPIGIGALDSDCAPITGSLEVIYSYPCGTDTAVIPLNGRLKLGTLCSPFACISTIPSLDFGSVAAGDTVTKSITFTNQTNDTVEIYLDMKGNDPDQFISPTQIINPVIILPYGIAEIIIGFVMPSTAPKNNYSAVLVAFERSSDGNFRCDTLFVSLNGNLLNNLGVADAFSNTSDFSLIPNPASGEVTITLPQNGTSTIEIYDVLGNLVLDKPARGEYVWSGDTQNGSAASGVYFVRVPVRASDGSITVSTKRLEFQR